MVYSSHLAVPIYNESLKIFSSFKTYIFIYNYNYGFDLVLFKQDRRLLYFLLTLKWTRVVQYLEKTEFWAETQTLTWSQFTLYEHWYIRHINFNHVLYVLETTVSDHIVTDRNKNKDNNRYKNNY